MTDIAKQLAFYGLRSLPADLRSRVLSDGSIAGRFGIGISSPIHILDKTVDRAQLFARFREAANGKPPGPLMDGSGEKVDARIEVDEAGDGSVQTGTTNVRFAHAGLLTTDVARRQGYAGRILADYTLTADQQEAFLTLTALPTFSDKDFFEAADIISASPERFARLFKEKLRQAKGNVAERDLLPDDVHHWENLTAEPRGSAELSAFIAGELAAERRRQRAANPARAYRAISLSFCAPALVPKDLLDELPSDSAVAMIEDIAAFDDPFALVGSFEYCAASLGRDPRFVTLGERLLHRLVTDMEWLRRAAAMWATAFVLATARLALDDRTRSRPVYWRRLAAASHASLIVRTTGVHAIDASDILAWAVRMRGGEYHCSILLDMAVEPGWRPEWADPGILTADIFSRAYGAFKRLPDGAAPAAWGDWVTKGMEWIRQKKLTLYLIAPAVLEGGLKRPPLALANAGEALAEIFERFITDPDIENLVTAAAASQRHGVPSEIIPSIIEVLARIRQGTANLDDKVVQHALTMCAHLTLLTSNAALADGVVQTVLDCSRGVTRRHAVDEAAFRIIEVSGALGDPAARQALLCQGLLALSNILPPNQLLEDLARLLEALTEVDPSLAAPLGRTIHTVRLGAPSQRM